MQAANKTLADEGVARTDVTVLLTTDAHVQELNREYRAQDRPTDVLSFGLRDTHPCAAAHPTPSSETEYLGDVVISVETAIRQAEAHGVTLEDELALLAVHGILHMLGHNDETPEGAAEMRLRESRALGGPAGSYDRRLCR